jgi:hypothetical protein
MYTVTDTTKGWHTIKRVENNLKENNNNDLLRKMDSLLSLLVEHTNVHKDCCLKNILKIIGDK